jgi:hypothetical protein
MLLAVSIVSVLLGLSAIFGHAIFQFAAIVLFVVFPTPLVVAIIYSRGTIRAFAIGTLIPWISLVGVGPPRNADWGDFVGLAIWLLFFGGISGGVAVATRRWIERHGQGGGL